MGRIHAIAIDCINDKISSKEDFTYDSICDEIVSKGGILRVSIGVTIGMYLKNLTRLKILNFSNDIFQTHEDYKSHDVE